MLRCNVRACTKCHHGHCGTPRKRVWKGYPGSSSVLAIVSSSENGELRFPGWNIAFPFITSVLRRPTSKSSSHMKTSGERKAEKIAPVFLFFRYANDFWTFYIWTVTMIGRGKRRLPWSHLFTAKKNCTAIEIQEKQPERLGVLPWVPTHAHEKNAREARSSKRCTVDSKESAKTKKGCVPLIQQRARREPDCDMLNVNWSAHGMVNVNHNEPRIHLPLYLPSSHYSKNMLSCLGVSLFTLFVSCIEKVILPLILPHAYGKSRTQCNKCSCCTLEITS